MSYGSQNFLRQSFISRIGKSGASSGKRRRSNRKWLRFESLEQRSMMAADFPVTFNVPEQVEDKGFYAAIFGELQEDYTPAGTNTPIPSGTWVYFDFTSNSGAGDFAATTGLTGDLLPTYQLVGNSVTVDIPNALLQSGQIVMSVGDSIELPVDSSNGKVTSPVASLFPENYFALFEWGVSAAATSGDPNILDIDVSNVDQLGFPFTVYATPTPSFPDDLGVGIPLSRADVFQKYHDYIEKIGETDHAALGFMDSLTFGDGYRILAPQNVLDQISGGPTAGTVGYTAGGGLTIGQAYNYWVSATSATGGETSVNNYTQGVPYTNSGTSTNYQTINVNWDKFQGAAGYKIYRSTTTSIDDAVLIGTVTGGNTTTFADNGITGTAATPPTTDYSFNPLNGYFNDALDSFFHHYRQNGGVEFQIHRDGDLFTGYVQDDYQFGGTGPEYTALVLNSTAFPNEDYVILKPYFSTNTPFANAPAPPNWLQNATQSPGAMVMANDGVFNTGGAQPNADAGVLSDLQNSIVAAFNRGIATNYDLPPDYWWNSPLLDAATPVSGGNLAEDKYFYVMTGANSDGNGGYFECVVSAELFAFTDSTDASVELSFQPLDSSVYSNYRIYRSTTQGGGYQLLDTIANDGQITSYTDDGSLTPTDVAPPMYFEPGSTSNWYGAFLVQNFTNNPVEGISIRGLAYGFGYGDNNGYSTNFTTNVEDDTTVTIDVQLWAGEIDAPEKIVVLSQPDAVRVKSAVTLEFQAQTASGTNYVGGGNVLVEILGAKKKNSKYTVALDDRTGEGSLTISNLKEGVYSFRITYANGPTVTTDTFSVLPKKTPKNVLDIMTGIDQQFLSTKAMKKALKTLTRYGING